MSYSKTTWTNGVTPINETNLNKIENELESLDTNKVSKSGDTMTGSLTATDFIGNTNGIQWDLNTNNTSNNWLPILNGNKLQHRTIDNIIETYSLKNLGILSDVQDINITNGFGRYDNSTQNVPTSDIAMWGTALFLATGGGGTNPHTVILIGNYTSNGGLHKIAIGTYVNNTWGDGWYYI